VVSQFFATVEKMHECVNQTTHMMLVTFCIRFVE